MTVSGTVDDDNVKHMLIHVLQDSQRYDPDVRLDAVDLLRMRNNDPEVRSALCRAVHTDHNAAVRLKALEALDGAEPQNQVRQTLLDALVDDQNPGVRVEAINELRDMAAKGEVDSDDHLLAVLRERIKKDPSTVHPAAERGGDSRSGSAAEILIMPASKIPAHGVPRRAGHTTSALIVLFLTGFILSLIAIDLALPSRLAADGKDKAGTQSADGSRLISESNGNRSRRMMDRG